MKKLILLSFFLILICFIFIQNTSAEIQAGGVDSSITKMPQESQKDICNEITVKMNATLLERLNCAKQVDYTIISFFKEMLAIQQNLTKELSETQKQLEEVKKELKELKLTLNNSVISSSNSPLTGMSVSENNQNIEKENKGFFGFFKRLFGLNK